jgi:hypothetical protein
VVPSLRIVENEFVRGSRTAILSKLELSQDNWKERKPVDTLYRLIFMTGSQRESYHGKVDIDHVSIGQPLLNIPTICTI